MFDSQTLHRDKPLATMTTIGVGGNAEFFCRARDEDELLAALQWAEREQHQVTLLAGGSNVVVPDEGLNGLVIQPDMTQLSFSPQANGTVVQAGAGLIWDELVAAAVERDLAGLECLSGIPGRVGAAPIQNIGAYGQELAQTCIRVKVYDRITKNFRSLEASECGFAYRSSLFKHGPMKGRFIVTALTLRLLPGGKPTIRYPDLVNRLGDDTNLVQVREAVLQVRGQKSMLADPDDPNARSCGSFFTNPILEPAAYQAFLKTGPGDHPHYPLDEGCVKLAAAWLIEQAGFSKGFRLGSAGLSQKHCLAIVNRGEATSQGIWHLATTIQEGVRRRFGVFLEPEPVVLANLP